ncbi:MAG: MATE family efflux transporter [Clostridia bacterium]|nr:MATE family efflux transporter [Clostridia bacterium]
MTSGTGIDLIRGRIRPNLLRFALPLFLGQLFQQLYNAVDALVVGNLVGQDALAAVTSTGSLIFLLVGFFGGVFGGVSVVIARCFGAGDEERLRRAVGTAVSTALISGAALTVIGVTATPALLRLMDTPVSVLPDAVGYLRIYFSGILTVILYNSANGIFQAVGDSRRPLYYLIVSSVVNVALDLFFVGGLHMGVNGAALATVLAQGLSAVLAYARLGRIDAPYRVTLRGVCLDRPLAKEMIRIGLPSGVQNSVIAFANVIVQSSVNSFGAAAVAGNGAYVKLEGFIFIPINAFCSAATTFVSQNIGAREYDRVKEGASFAVGFSCVCAAVLGVIFFITAPMLVGMFGKSPEAIAAGVLRGRICSVAYVLLALSHGIAAVCRGAGYAKVPMYVMLGVWCVFRVAYIQVVIRLFHSIAPVFLAYPITWAISSVIFLWYYRRSNWLERIRARDLPPTE